MTIASHPCPEQVVQLGSDGYLVAIATTAVPGQTSIGRAARYIIVNAGVLHRVGPHRLHVDLARQLSASGFSGVRVDLSGIGDSRGVPSTMTFWESAVTDLRAVIDDLSPDSACFVIGLCSGADNALAAAIADPRIKGLVLLDPPAYATRRSKLRKLQRRLREQGGPFGALRWVARRILRSPRGSPGSRAAAADPSDSANSGGRITPRRDEWGQQLQQLCDRGVRILCIYSGAYDERYNHAGQIWEWFPQLKGRLEVWYEPDSNHVFTSASIRRKLVSGIDAWCVAAFG